MIDNGMICFGRKASDLSKKICLDPKMVNRHGFICGATGTGKTITLKVLAESFSKMGVPVFLSDIKGDLAGMCKAGTDSEDMRKRIEKYGLLADGFTYEAFPTNFYDIYGVNGIPLRTTVSEMGPLLLAQILSLNDNQTDLLQVVFKVADDHGLLLLDTKDLKAALTFCAESAKDLEMEYGHIAKASISTIIRAIVALETEGGDRFFGEPAIDINDFFSVEHGLGMINILDSESLINKPRLYSAFMLYLLSELFEVLPEVGDVDRPKMVFFFDEAHLLFANCKTPLMEKINQVIKLIRSKGVGIFFVTQSPADIPEGVMAQLSNKIEHALRAYTPAEMKALKAAAESFRENPEFDTTMELQQLGTGEALVSTLDDKGVPSVTEHVCILPPESLMGTISDMDRKACILSSKFYEKYINMIDSESAYEFLSRRRKQLDDEATEAKEEQIRIKEEAAIRKEEEKLERQREKEYAAYEKARQKEDAKAQKEAEKLLEKQEKERLKEQKKLKTSAKSVLSTTAGTIGRELGRSVGSSILGNQFGKTLGGNIGASLGRNILGTLFKT